MQEIIEQMPELRKLHPVIYAARLHAQLATVHPFIDGNGRTARLLMNLSLLQNGYPITSIPPIVRGDYIATIKDTNHGDFEKFDNFISCMVWEAQRDYVRLIKALNPANPW